MKKPKMLVATLVCAVLLMGVGYAWWTDSISINGTVATGNMTSFGKTVSLFTVSFNRSLY